MDTDDEKDRQSNSHHHVESISLIADDELREADSRYMERPVSHNFEGMAEFSCGNTRKWPVAEATARAIIRPQADLTPSKRTTD